MPKLEAYNRRLPYSYCLGLFPCHALLDSRPERVTRLLLHPDGYGSEGVEKLRERCRALDIREESAERVLKRESKKDNCFAALVFDKYDCALDPTRDHAVFCQISDGGNLGTCARAALGFGYNDIAMVRPCVDPFDPHVLRASMGAFFRLNARVYETFDDYRAQFSTRVLYPFMLSGAIPLNDAACARVSPHSLVFGNEASGLDTRFSELGQAVRIPQSDQIDSLNLAVAASIAMYTFKNIQ